MLPIQPWMIKGGAVVLFLLAVFFSGCRVQKQMDKAKIQKLKANYSRAINIIDTFQDNVDTLNMAIKDQNAAITELGKETEQKINSINTAHNKAITRLNAANSDAIREAEEEAAALRRRMVGLSVGEACHEAWLEVIQ